jgi:hypothetical protein
VLKEKEKKENNKKEEEELLWLLRGRRLWRGKIVFRSSPKVPEEDAFAVNKKKSDRIKCLVS